MSKLRYIERKIYEIKDNIAAAKNHLNYPGMLTKEEIDGFDIDLYKLK